MQKLITLRRRSGAYYQQTSFIKVEFFFVRMIWFGQLVSEPSDIYVYTQYHLALEPVNSSNYLT